MSKEKEKTSSPDFIVLGNGAIGEKASQLLTKTEVLKKLGFRVPKRIILAEDFLQENILNPDEMVEHIYSLCLDYGNVPLAIRSSAVGDARGTGTYESVFVENDIVAIEDGIETVLASYHSPDAIAFRQDAATGEGFGIIIEPIIGQLIDRDYLPILSGYGYTSTSRGEGYISVVPGLGCSVESHFGEKITQTDVDATNGTLGHYIRQKRRNFFDEKYQPSYLLRTDDIRYNNNYTCQAFICSDETNGAHIVTTSIEYPEETEQMLYELKLSSFFSIMAQMEQAFGKPQYLEWAMTIESGEPVFWIVQIADVDKKLDFFEFSESNNAILAGHTVHGTGTKEVTQIVQCFNPEDIANLHKFNQSNKNYLLLFSSTLTSSGGTKDQLTYSNFSNASAFLEIEDIKHAGNPLAHLMGQLEMTGKLFAVRDYDEETAPNWDLLREKAQKIDELTVIAGNFKVVASERQNKLVVYNEVTLHELAKPLRKS